MFDIHLINMALAGIGVSAAAALMIAAAVITIAAVGQHRQALRRGRALRPTSKTSRPVSPVKQEPALR